MSECQGVIHSIVGIGDRLKEERIRLGLNQTDFARMAGVQKNAQSNYELGERSPTASYLSAIAASGVDVQYVLNGTRMRESPSDLSPEEIELLNNYKKMSVEDRAAILHLSGAVLKK